ncbi:hypothetical protein CC86DRAFT_42554 [Ophiobolus disseminans]|uniref:Uncharacterized protein n=1 Tax=Ophiobolus disseminans TaxID=1469910 RepID=A0A6A6ZWG9_9PLEO|nr:hypothetical protein CC86DRAFT_42554 [Ophiobolus disseminans]
MAARGRRDSDYPVTSPPFRRTRATRAGTFVRPPRFPHSDQFGQRQPCFISKPREPTMRPH